MTGQFTLFFTLLTQDLSWVRWVGPLMADVETGKLAGALRINSDQLKRYMGWLEDHGYLKVMKRVRGRVRIQLTQLSSGFLATVRPEALLPSPAERERGLSAPSRRGQVRGKDVK